MHFVTFATAALSRAWHALIPACSMRVIADAEETESRQSLHGVGEDVRPPPLNFVQCGIILHLLCYVEQSRERCPQPRPSPRGAAVLVAPRTC